MAARARSAADTRQRLLDAAWRHFAERPFEDVRLADIAVAAGVTVQTLHAQLGTKEETFVAAWEWTVGPEGTRRNTVPVGDVATAVRVLYDSYEAQGDAVLRLLAAEERIPAVRRMTDRGRDWHRDWVRRTFAPLLSQTSGAARQRRLTSLVVTTDLLVWKLLRRDMKLSRREAERIVVGMIGDEDRRA